MIPRYLLLIVIAFYFLSCSKTNRPVLKEYLLVHNKHDIEKALYFYNEDIAFEISGVWIKKDINKIRELEEWDSVVNSHIDFTVKDERGDTLFCVGTEINDWFTKVGVNEVKYDSILFIFDSNKLKYIHAKPNREVNIKVNQAMNSIAEFTESTNNNILTELIPREEFIYSKESATKWLNLLDE